MESKYLDRIGRYICLILRHKPEMINIELDKNGYAKVDELINGIKCNYCDFNFDILRKIVEIDDKKRYSFNEDKTLIKCNQGHSIAVDVELKKMEPPAILYHGTALKYCESIDKFGIIAKNRLYVHLSDNIEAAKNIGKRHGEEVVYIINSKQMWRDGYEFYQSKNQIWLTKKVPINYMKKIL